MTIKEFLRPTKAKIIFGIVLFLIIPFYTIIEMDGGPDTWNWIFFSGPLALLRFILGLIIDFNFITNYFLLTISYLIISYIISCIIILVFKK